MTTVKYLCLVVLVFLGASPSFAAGFSGEVTLAEVRYNSFGIVLKTTVPHANPDSCDRPTEIFIPPAQITGNDLLVSMFVTALASKRPIRIMLDGCTGTSPDAYATSRDPAFDLTLYD